MGVLDDFKKTLQGIVNGVGQDVHKVEQGFQQGVQRVAQSKLSDYFLPTAPYVQQGVKNVVKAVQTNPQQFNYASQLAVRNPNVMTGFKPLDIAGQIVGSYVNNNMVQPAIAGTKQVAHALNPTTNATLPDRAGSLAMGGLNLFRAAPLPTNQAFNLAYQTYQGAAGANAAKIRGQNQLQGGLQAFTGEKQVGLGSALTTNKTGETIGNLAELPLALLLTHKMGSGANSKELNTAIKMAKDANNVDEFTQAFRNAPKPVIDSVTKVINDNKSPVNSIVDFFNVAKTNKPKGLPVRMAPQDVKKVLTNQATPQERGFITSVKVSAKTPQVVKDIVSGNYIPKTGSQLRADAKALIKSDPVTAEQLALNPQNATHVQIGNVLLDHYYATGQIAKAKQLSEQMASGGTEFGQAVQAFSNYDKTTPAGAVRFAQSKINEYNRLNPAKKLAITDNQVQSLFDKAHKIQQMAEGRDRNIAANDLMETVNNLIPSSFADKAITVWKAGLLTSLRTHERNLIGNTLHGGAEVAKDIPAMIADRLMAARTGQRSMSTTLKGVGSGTVSGLKAAKDIITKGYDPEHAIAKYDVRRITWGNNPVEQTLKKYTDSVFRTLGGADKPFYNAAFGRSMYDQAITAAGNAGRSGDRTFIENLVKNPTTEMLATATKEAEVATFHIASKLSEAAQKIQAFKPLGIPVGQVVAPFTGVPSAIAGQMIAYSPAGLINGAVKVGRVLAGQVPELQRQASQEVGRGVIGTGLLGIGAYLMSKGIMTGQPKDQAEARQWQLEGKQANSVLIGGKWRSIGSIGPELLVALAGAKAQQEFGQGGSGDVGKLAGNIGKDFMGQTFLQGMSAPLNAITDPNRYGTAYLGNQIASLIPNIVKDTSKALDPYQRENNAVKDYVTNSLPVVRNQNLVKRDVLGNPLPQEPTGIAAFTDLFNSKTPVTNNPVVSELSRLNAAGQNATPSNLNKNQTIAGQKMQLTDSQVNVLSGQQGPQIQTALSQLMKDPTYQQLSDEEKKNAIDNVISNVRKVSRATTDVNSLTPNNTGVVSNTKTATSTTIPIVNPETGAVKMVQLNWTPPKLNLTGNAELDKKLLTKYRSEITSRGNDIIALYKAGKITAQEAETQLNGLKTLTNKSGTGKSSKVPKIKVARIKAVRVSSKKVPKLSYNLPKFRSIPVRKPSASLMSGVVR